jgi:hypothetical protein
MPGMLFSNVSVSPSMVVLGGATSFCNIPPRDFDVLIWCYSNHNVMNKYLFEELTCGMKFIRKFVNPRRSFVFLVGGEVYPEFEQNALG